VKTLKQYFEIYNTQKDYYAGIPLNTSVLFLFLSIISQKT